MTNFVKVISNAIESGFRKIKIRRYGNDDLQTPAQSTPFGIDSAPPKGMIAVYAETHKKGKPVIIGYLNKSLLAADGETRIFSLQANGTLATFIWLKADGTMQIGGNTKNMVRFQELESGFNQLKADFNSFITTYNSHVHSGVTTGGGSSGPTAGSGSQSSASIAGAKINEIKTL
jgi:hypothetical protein